MAETVSKEYDIDTARTTAHVFFSKWSTLPLHYNETRKTILGRSRKGSDTYNERLAFVERTVMNEESFAKILAKTGNADLTEKEMRALFLDSISRSHIPATIWAEAALTAYHTSNDNEFVLRFFSAFGWKRRSVGFGPNERIIDFMTDIAKQDDVLDLIPSESDCSIQKSHGRKALDLSPSFLERERRNVFMSNSSVWVFYSRILTMVGRDQNEAMDFLRKFGFHDSARIITALERFPFAKYSLTKQKVLDILTGLSSEKEGLEWGIEFFSRLAEDKPIIPSGITDAFIEENKEYPVEFVVETLGIGEEMNSGGYNLKLDALKDRFETVGCSDKFINAVMALLSESNVTTATTSLYGSVVESFLSLDSRLILLMSEAYGDGSMPDYFVQMMWGSRYYNNFTPRRRAAVAAWVLADDDRAYRWAVFQKNKKMNDMIETQSALLDFPRKKVPIQKELKAWVDSKDSFPQSLASRMRWNGSFSISPCTRLKKKMDNIIPTWKEYCENSEIDSHDSKTTIVGGESQSGK